MRKRNIRVVVHLNEKEYEALNRNCTAAGMRREQVIRKLILGLNINPRPPDSYRELSKELAAIGNNINQITHLANSVGTVSPAQIEAVQYRMEQVWQLVQERV